jgi:hypothetical protein
MPAVVKEPVTKESDVSLLKNSKGDVCSPLLLGTWRFVALPGSALQSLLLAPLDTPAGLLGSTGVYS